MSAYGQGKGMGTSHPLRCEQESKGEIAMANCERCGLHYDDWQLITCERCQRRCCVSCSRGHRLYAVGGGDVAEDVEAWVCEDCYDELTQPAADHLRREDD
jgi:hypothetical protein